jgi:uncharacterized membrane protein
LASGTIASLRRAVEEASSPKGVAKRYERGSEEFSRTLALSDGVFAIAMTLLVVGIALPTIDNSGNASEMLDALDDLSASFISFFISFAVIARYWAAHQEQFSMLARMDRGFVGLNLVYLAFIALLPFPTDLLGNFFENPISITIYATNVGIISGMEVVLFREAYRADLLAASMPEDVYRWGVVGASSPVVIFMLSIPVAFLSTTAAAAVWLLTVPVGVLLHRLEPTETLEYLR